MKFKPHLQILTFYLLELGTTHCPLPSSDTLPVMEDVHGGGRIQHGGGEGDPCVSYLLFTVHS